MTLTLKDFFHLCLKRFWVILLCIFVLALGGGLYAKFAVKKTYTSELAFVLRSGETSLTPEAEYKFTTQILQNCIAMIKQPQYFRFIAQSLEAKGYDADAKDLAEEVSYSSTASSTLIYVSVTTTDAEYSLAVAQVIQSTVPDYLDEHYPVQDRVLKVADLPVKAEEANPTKTVAYIVVCALLGLILAVVILLLIYYLDVSVKSERDLTERYEAPVLGVIPKFWTEESVSKKNIIRRDFLLDEHSQFELIESYRNLMSNVGFAVPKKDGAIVICVTSSCAGEGKSTISANLAYTFANSGKNVLLIDCDLRKGRMNKFFHSSATVGLSNYLCGLSTLDEIVHPTGFDRLDAIYAGGAAPNPIELLQSPYATELLDALSPRYDYIFIDTPPVEVVADALTLIPKTDGVIFVASEHVSKHTNLVRSLSRLEFSQCKLRGFVLGDSRTMIDTYKARSYRQYYDTPKSRGGES